jgi:hypothetical protein
MRNKYLGIVRVLMVLVLAVVLNGVLAVMPAGAQTVWISPAEGPVNTVVTVVATEYAPNSILTATFDGVVAATAPAVVETDGTGTAAFAMLVPTATAGVHTVVVWDGVNYDTETFTVQPKVAISPTQGSVGTSVTVTGTGFGAGFTVNVTVGGQPLASTVTDSTGSFTTVGTIPTGLAIGAHDVSAYDLAANSATLIDGFLLTSTSPQPPGGVEYWAVIVGISDYPGTENDLFYCHQDAEDLYNLLLTSEVWSSDHIILLTDSDATANAIDTAISIIDTLSDSNDIFLFYFSGHGHYLEDREPIDEWDGWDEGLMPYDSSEYWLPDDNMAATFANLPMSNIAVVIDACWSGGMIRSGSISSSLTTPMQLDVPQSEDGFIRDFQGVLDGVVLTASAEDEPSASSSFLEHGIFSYYFMEALSKGRADINGNGLVSMEEAFLYVYPSVSTYWPTPPNQHPQIYDNYPGELEIFDLRTSQLPCCFYGTVQIDGEPVLDGTVITATIGEDSYNTTTPSVYGNSTYELEITPPLGTNYIEGTPINFQIGNQTVDQTSTWITGGNVNLNLSVTTTPTEPPPQIGYVDIPLYEGYNLVSLPLVPDDPSIEAALADVWSNVRNVWGYDNLTKAWNGYTRGIGGLLTTMEECKGYWVYMLEADTLTVWGSPAILYE